VLLLASAIVAGRSLLRDDDGSDERRAAVADYIRKVNTSQQAVVLELEQVNKAYRELQLRAKPVPGQLKRVEAAERSLVNLRARLARLPVPRDAARLHSELLRLVELQVAFAHEVVGMVRYLPLQAEEHRKLAAATDRLRAALEGATAGATQRTAFEAYRRAVRAVIGRLERASAPPVLEPSRTGEIERLERLDTLAARLGRALDEQRVEEIDPLFAEFVRASADTGTTQAERQAVIAYNRRLAAITDQRTAVSAERTRLDAVLQ
jgi:hypothetical protein